MDRLIAELQDAQFKLEVGPTTTLEFVHTLTFLDDIQVRVSGNIFYYIDSSVVCLCEFYLRGNNFNNYNGSCQIFNKW